MSAWGGSDFTYVTMPKRSNSSMDKVTFLTHLPEILHRILPRLINHALDFLIYCNFGSKKTAGDPARIFDLLIDYVGPLFLGKKALKN